MFNHFLHEHLKLLKLGSIEVQPKIKVQEIRPKSGNKLVDFLSFPKYSFNNHAS